MDVAAASSSDIAHGTRQAYSGGCRCAACRAAWAEYMRNRRRGLRPAERVAAPQGERSSAYYPGKESDPLASALTPLGRQILTVTQARTHRSRGDIFEHLLRLYGPTLEFADAPTA